MKVEITAICSIYSCWDWYVVQFRYMTDSGSAVTSIKADTLQEAESYNVGDKVEIDL